MNRSGCTHHPAKPAPCVDTETIRFLELSLATACVSAFESQLADRRRFYPQLVLLEQLNGTLTPSRTPLYTSGETWPKTPKLTSAGLASTKSAPNSVGFVYLDLEFGKGISAEQRTACRGTARMSCDRIYKISAASSLPCKLSPNATSCRFGAGRIGTRLTAPPI